MVLLVPPIKFSLLGFKVSGPVKTLSLRKYHTDKHIELTQSVAKLLNQEGKVKNRPKLFGKQIN